MMPDLNVTLLTVMDRAVLWRRTGHYGISSLAIWTTLSGLTDWEFERRASWTLHTPRDPSDLNRCVALLDLIPEWRPLLARVGERFPEWELFLARWDEMEVLLRRDMPTGKSAELYDLMTKLNREAWERKNRA